MTSFIEFLIEKSWNLDNDELLVGRSELKLDEEDLFEMANVREKQSGIPYVIFISSKDAALSKHGPRIKVSNRHDRWDPSSNFVITVPELRVVGTATFSSDQLEDIKDWIRLNKDLIVKYWNKEIDDQELLNTIEKL
jgi:hypothetical protein